MKKNDISFALMATTGRAAKVLEEKTGYSATTVHSLLYAFTEIKEETEKPDDNAWAHDTGQLFLKFDLRTNYSMSYRLFIVDEASMISHLEEQKPYTARFGSGNLLLNLMKYVASKRAFLRATPANCPRLALTLFQQFWIKGTLWKPFGCRCRKPSNHHCSPKPEQRNPAISQSFPHRYRNKKFHQMDKNKHAPRHPGHPPV